MTQISLQEIESRLNQLSLADKAKLINGISLEAAQILKTVLPNSPVINSLLLTKVNLDNLF